jgi:hypothetical protein
MTKQGDFTARVIREMLGSSRMTLFPRSAGDKPLPSIPVPKPPPPDPNASAEAFAAFVIRAGKLRRGEPVDDENPADGSAPLRPGELVLNAIAKQRREGK